MSFHTSDRKPLLDDASDESDYVIQTSADSKDKPWIPARYILVILAFFGFFNLYALRVNLSVAIVAMVGNAPSLNANTLTSEECPLRNSTGSSSSSAKGEFNWDSYTQGIILGSFFYGYIFTQLPGAWIAKRFGPKQPFGLSAFLAGLLALLIPVAARWSYWALIAVRVLQGVVEGVCFPSMHTMMGNWAPPLERTKMVTFAYCGMHLGNVGAMVLSGMIAESWGWESVFYFFGALSCAWYFVWLWFAFDTPEKHPRISAQERSFIVSSINHSKSGEVSHIPWKRLLSSWPVWAICVGHFGNNWGFYTLLTSLPTYFSKILHFSLKENGTVSALPYLVLLASMPSMGYIADRLRRKHRYNTTYIRKIFHFVGQLLPALCLICVGYIGCDVFFAVLLLTIAVGSTSIAASGFQVNHIDISPAYAGILMGITNTVATIPGIAGPYVVGLVTNGQEGQTVAQWRIVFYISAAVYVVTALFYVIFASGEPQNWEKKKAETPNDEE
ncbi:sialin-like isoform X2 [Paramacrobiotus metropolitanus]|uniref:sialin-like isoform X2 n=1 Tax=Paramacrobiotus metropolitanus TaxID=2943436 RepID=UPI00244639D2|nr:sialin-like isoform X2 [Paramacrobiotus metropolitanus]